MADPGAPPPSNPYRQPGHPYLPPNVAVPQPPDPTPRRSSGRGGVAVLVVALLALAVGAGAFLVLRSDDDPTPGEAVRDWVMAVYDQDVARICGGLAASNIELIEAEGTSCEEEFEGTFEVLEEPDGADAPSGPDDEVDLLRPISAVGDSDPSITILDVEIKGDRAAVRVQVDDSETGATRPIILVKEDGRWKLDFNGGETIDGPSRSCEVEQRTVRTAVEAHRAQTGEDPADAQALVDSGMLRALPEHAEVASDGTVRMTGECA